MNDGVGGGSGVWILLRNLVFSDGVDVIVERRAGETNATQRKARTHETKDAATKSPQKKCGSGDFFY